MKTGLLNWARKYHKWPALIISLFLLMIVISGILMNHRDLISRYNTARKYLPKAYQLQNWNLASVRSSEKLSNDSIILYGNSGIWITDSLYREYEDFNTGFSKGMDKRKIRVVKATPGGNILAGTYFGLFLWNPISGSVINVLKPDIPVRNKRSSGRPSENL